MPSIEPKNNCERCNILRDVLQSSNYECCECGDKRLQALYLANKANQKKWLIVDIISVSFLLGLVDVCIYCMITC